MNTIGVLNTDPIREFLLACLAEDEAKAKRWRYGARRRVSMLVDIAAKRAIVESCGPYCPDQEHGDTGPWVEELVLRHLTQPFADRPGYDEAWRP